MNIKMSEFKHLLNLQLLKCKSAYVGEHTVVNSNIPALIRSGNTTASGFLCKIKYKIKIEVTHNSSIKNVHTCSSCCL